MQLCLRHLLHFLFPPSADEELIEACTPSQFRDKLHTHIGPYNIRVLSSFKDPHIRAALHLSKYHNNHHAHLLLSSLLATWLASVKDEVVIVPVPLSEVRMRQRGHNQVETVAAFALAEAQRHTVCTNVLYRVRNTPPQTSLKRDQRRLNLADAFAVHAQAALLLQGKQVVLLDDVITTGATLQSAHKALQSCGALSIQCVALAH